MRLLLLIVQAEDADLLVAKLVERGLRVTRINSVGSFLMRGNATILVGLQDEQVEEALAIVRVTCLTRTSYINAVPAIEAAGGYLAMAMPLETQIGGAVVFSFPVTRFLRLQGGTAPAVADEHHSEITPADVEGFGENGGDRMNLVLAIAQNDNADQVVGGLLAAGHRVTRLNTAGGFLRRGNVTLLIGTANEKVDGVLQIMQANLPLRTEPRPPDAGMPAYGATVFVLAADRFVRM